MANYKAEATAQQIASDLALRVGLAAVVDLSGTDPVVSFGTQAIGGRCFKVKVLDQRGGASGNWQALPGFGSVAQPIYTGSVIQIAYEKSIAGNWPISTSILPDDLLEFIGDSTRRGARVELYSTAANGAVPAFDAIVAAFDPNLYYPLSGRV